MNYEFTKIIRSIFLSCSNSYFLQQIRSLPQYAKEPWNLQTEENAWCGVIIMELHCFFSVCSCLQNPFFFSSEHTILNYRLSSLSLLFWSCFLAILQLALVFVPRQVWCATKLLFGEELVPFWQSSVPESVFLYINHRCHRRIRIHATTFQTEYLITFPVIYNQESKLSVYAKKPESDR